MVDYSTTDSDSQGGIDYTYKAKNTYGIKMPPGSQSGDAGDEAAGIIVGMFWPYTQDAKSYTMGPAMALKLSVELKLDFGGDITWGVLGMNFEVTNGVDFKIGFEADEWAAWGMNTFGAAANYTAAKASAVGSHIIAQGSSLLSNTAALGLNGSEVDTNVTTVNAGLLAGV